MLRVVGNDDVNRDFSITVNVSGNAGYSINFWANRNTIDRGQCTTLRWDVRNVQAVYLNEEGVAGVSQREVCPDKKKTYDLTITKNDGGQNRRQVTINVNNAQPPQPAVRILRFDVDRNIAFLGQCVTIEWRTDDAEGVSLLRNGEAIVEAGAGNNSYEDCYGEFGVYEYDLTAYNRSGRETRSLSVTVQDASD